MTTRARFKPYSHTPLQNRVDPFGCISAVAARGLFTGNRGVIHDPATKTLTGRRWTTKSWIVCSCEWKGKRRETMGRNSPNGKAGWTELFFLDEVTALAAGHRPCFFCRRTNAKAFATAFSLGNRLVEAKAPKMDAILHRQRLQSARSGPIELTVHELAELPDGSVVGSRGTAYVRKGSGILEWSFSGYGSPERLAVLGPCVLVTPKATVAALRSGYQPVWHRTAP